ncbi:hypothetical protein MASR2M79_24700 [Aminivibrio sp.]
MMILFASSGKGRAISPLREAVGFDMSHGDMPVEGGEGGRHGGGGVSVDEDEVGGMAVEVLPHSGQHPGGYSVEGLAFLHDPALRSAAIPKKERPGRAWFQRPVERTTTSKSSRRRA